VTDSTDQAAPAAGHDLGPAPRSVRLAALAAILLPLAGVAAAPVVVWGWGFGWTDLALLAGLYLLTGLGVTVGFHRLFVHRSFETSVWVKVPLAVLGSMAAQGSLFTWAAHHRRHHRHSDTPADPHSPHHHRGGARGVLGGFWHAHVGWAFRADPPHMERYIKDLAASRALRVTSRLFPLWVALGLALPAAIGGLVAGAWAGALTGLIWGGLVRVFLVHHVTWSVNSACHLWGRRPYKSGDESRNNAVLGVLALGEGWHNTHHAFPTSARHGLAWWEVDASYWVIRGLAAAGLAWNVKVPSRAARERARRPGRAAGRRRWQPARTA
jgi:stearoyl-CoA desaturase (delta-9 desaturase)